MSAPYQTIDTRWGTRNSHRLGQGNTLPYTGVPFGMNHFVLETRPGEPRFPSGRWDCLWDSFDPPTQSLDG